MYPLKSAESIKIYWNTHITLNGVEKQTIEKLENGLIDSQQPSQCYINATCGKARPQNVET